MLNIHLSYNPPSSCRIMFRSGGVPRQFSRLKKFRALVVPSRGCHKGIILQIIMIPTGVLPNVNSFLRRKGDVTGAYIHAPRYRDSPYVQMVRRSIYETTWPKHPHLPILQYKRRPQGPTLQPHYRRSFRRPTVTSSASPWDDLGPIVRRAREWGILLREEMRSSP